MKFCLLKHVNFWLYVLLMFSILSSLYNIGDDAMKTMKYHYKLITRSSIIMLHPCYRMYLSVDPHVSNVNIYKILHWFPYCLTGYHIWQVPHVGYIYNTSISQAIRHLCVMRHAILFLGMCVVITIKYVQLYIYIYLMHVFALQTHSNLFARKFTMPYASRVANWVKLGRWLIKMTNNRGPKTLPWVYIACK